MKLEQELAIYDAALEEWGLALQAMMLMEECGELIAKLNQWLRGRTTVDELMEEMVDVDIMLNQIRRAVNDESKWAMWRDWKMERVKGRIPEATWVKHLADALMPHGSK